MCHYSPELCPELVPPVGVGGGGEDHHHGLHPRAAGGAGGLLQEGDIAQVQDTGDQPGMTETALLFL